jgi:hypothetical protein
MFFKSVEHGLAETLVIRKHYLHRPCPVSWAFGIFVDEQIKGVLTIGKPCSSTVCSGVCGKDRAHDVYELNRLWLDDCLPHNSESRFIGWCLRELRKMNPNLILVSYADTKQEHIGYIYQATGWLYTGTSTPWTDKLLNGQKVVRSIKHRYVWLIGCHRKPQSYDIEPQKLRRARQQTERGLLRWKVLPYPKREQVGA